MSRPYIQHTLPIQLQYAPVVALFLTSLIVLLSNPIHTYYKLSGKTVVIKNAQRAELIT